MTKEEIIHLGTLSRLSLSDREITNFGTEISAILAYVGAVSKMAGTGELRKEVGVVYNQMRPDVVTTEPGQYTEVMLAAAPTRQGQYFLVQKIIAQDE